WLPEGTKVPDWQGQPILLRHVVTHTSGLPALPSRLGAKSMDDPYAKLDEVALLASLGDVKLAAAPGTKFEYSNFAMMVLSQAIARRADTDFESLARRELFAPLGMGHAYVNQLPAGVRVATGHAPSGQAVPAWHFATNLAGVGGVRATLDDMVRYVQGGLGRIDVPVVRALQKTHEPLSEQMGMNWMRVPVNGRTVLMHEGGTGGFSAFVSLDPQRQRGVVILSDTTWNSIGSLGSLGLHLVDASFPLGGPRKVVAADPGQLQALAGEYQLEGAMKMTLRQRDGRLFVQAEGQGEYEMGHDDAGDFFPVALDAVLRPQRRADGSYGFTWMQMGAMFPATRLDRATKAPSLSAAELAAYAGDYPLMPSFSLNVRERDGRLYAQATGQGAFPLDATAVDTFEAPAFGIEIVFHRDGGGQVESLELHQAGHVMRGQRQH
ncbi:MAG: serine hydrolase, partial [Pseudoxanthomonas sp.]|nr:serine hydrolase [Pseudoxanthomonas sp.]